MPHPFISKPFLCMRLMTLGSHLRGVVTAEKALRMFFVCVFLYRKGSVIVNFTTTFKAVDSDQILRLLDTMENKQTTPDIPMVVLSLSAPRSK